MSQITIPLLSSLLVIESIVLFIVIRKVYIYSTMQYEQKILRKLGDLPYMQRSLKGFDFANWDLTYWQRKRWVWMTNINWILGRCKYDAMNDRLTFYPED